MSNISANITDTTKAVRVIVMIYYLDYVNIITTFTDSLFISSYPSTELTTNNGSKPANRQPSITTVSPPDLTERCSKYETD
jgi:hypothetical protein